MGRGVTAGMLLVLSVLCLCVICQGQPEMSGGCKVCGNISVKCPTTVADQKTHKLLRNGELLHSVNYNTTYNQTRVLSTSELSQHSINQSDQSSYFLVTQLNLNSSGLYTCKVCVLYPPPFQCNENSTAVVFIEHSPEVKSTCGPSPSPTSQGVSCRPDLTKTPYLVALGLITLYALLLTPFAFKLWRTRKSSFHDHDYINMRHLGRRRFNGVQHPIHPEKHSIQQGNQ